MIRFLLIFIMFSAQVYADEFVGGIIRKNNKESIVVKCIEKESDEICKRAHFFFKTEDDYKQLGKLELSKEVIEDFLEEVLQFELEDLTNDRAFDSLTMDYIGLTSWLYMVALQSEHKAFIGTTGVIKTIAFPIEIIKKPFSFISKKIHSAKQKNRDDKLSTYFSTMTDLRLLKEKDLIKIKIDKDQFDDLVVKLDRSVFIEKNENKKLKRITRINHEKVNIHRNVELVSIYKANTKIYSSAGVNKSDESVIASHTGMVYFFDKDFQLTKKVKSPNWVHQVVKYHEKNKVFTVPSYDGGLFLYNGKGEVKDVIYPGGEIFSPTLELPNKNLVIGSDDGHVYVIDLKTKEKIAIKTEKMVHGQPLLMDDEYIVFGSNDHKLYFCDLQGNILDVFETNGPLVHSAPVLLNNGQLVFGSYDKNIYFVKFNGKKASLVKKVPTNGWVHSSPLVAKDENGDEIIVIGSNDGYLYFLANDGKVINRFDAHGKVISSPAQLKDGTIVVGSYDGNVYFVDLKGQEVAKFKTNNKIWSSPAVFSDGMTIIIGSGDHTIYFLRIK